MPVVMFSADGTVKSAVHAIHQGAVDFLEKPFTPEQFKIVLARLKRFSEMGKKIERLEDEVMETQAQSPEVITEFDTPGMKTVIDILKRAAVSPASVLIVGESGTGKSVAAKALHAQSHLANQPFVTVSCPSLSKELLESQLFGHVRGAFTGALREHWGKVKAADGGTLFLDEIGDLPLDIQPKLLRLLQEREYERVGETVIRHANVRIVAATNRDLQERVASGAFREDLFYRLNVITVEMPPLRSCPRDILRLARLYLKHSARQAGRIVSDFTPEAAQLLRAYSWPGNLRELRNMIERAVILSSSDKLDVADLPAEVRRGAAPRYLTASPAIGSMISIKHLEESHIRHVISRCDNLVEAAEVLGIDQATLYRKRKRMGLFGGSQADDSSLADSFSPAACAS